jgi:hypothetical protein
VLEAARQAQGVTLRTLLPSSFVGQPSPPGGPDHAKTAQRAGSLRAGQLSGSAAGAVTLTGSDNAIDVPGDFSAQGLGLVSHRTLLVSGRVDGGPSLRPRSGGDLQLSGQLSGAASGWRAVAANGNAAEIKTQRHRASKPASALRIPLPNHQLYSFQYTLLTLSFSASVCPSWSRSYRK